MAKTLYRPEYRELVARLRDLRLKRGESQTALAKQLGWPQQRISFLENGVRRLDVIEFLELTAALGLSPTAAMRMAASCMAEGQASSD